MPERNHQESPCIEWVRHHYANPPINSVWRMRKHPTGNKIWLCSLDGKGGLGCGERFFIVVDRDAVDVAVASYADVDEGF